MHQPLGQLHVLIHIKTVMHLFQLNLIATSNDINIYDEQRRSNAAKLIKNREGGSSAGLGCRQ